MTSINKKSNKFVFNVVVIIIALIMTLVLGAYFLLNSIIGPFDWRTDQQAVESLESEMQVFEGDKVTFMTAYGDCKVIEYEYGNFAEFSDNDNCFSSFEYDDSYYQEFDSKADEDYKMLAKKLSNNLMSRFEASYQSEAINYAEFTSSCGFCGVSYIYTTDIDSVLSLTNIPGEMEYNRVGTSEKWVKLVEDWN
jgi:hypothetical protein